MLLFRKIPLGLLRFPINKIKTLRNHQSFHDMRLEKNLKNISGDVRCISKDSGQGRGNMGKSSFAFKRNVTKRSEFHFY